MELEREEVKNSVSMIEVKNSVSMIDFSHDSQGFCIGY